jgi:hypothetical protein
MKHPDSSPQDPTLATKRKLSVAQRVGAITSLAAAGLTGGVASIVIGHAAHSGHERSVAATASANYRKSLEGELRSAYVGPVAVTRAEATGQVTTDNIGEKRGAINIHIRGAAINEKTAHSTGDPSYYYEPQPVDSLVLPNGQKYPGEVFWTDQKDGDAVMRPLLSNFSGNKLTTRDYEIDLGVEGLIPSSPAQGTGGMREIDGVYNAGEVAVTGKKGQITAVAVIPRSAAPAVRIIGPRS